MRQLPQRQPRIYGDPPLPAGTRVRHRVLGMPGIVGACDSSVGQFPVDWADGVQSICLCHEVIVLS